MKTKILEGQPSNFEKDKEKMKTNETKRQEHINLFEIFKIIFFIKNQYSLINI